MTYKTFLMVLATLALAALACNAGEMLQVSDQGLGPRDATSTPQPLIEVEATQAQSVETPIPVDIQPAGPVLQSVEVCLPTGEGGTEYINEQGGYCFLLPEGFSVREDNGLDIFVVGPTLETFGQEGLVLAFGFSVIGAPNGAGNYTAEAWGAEVTEKHSVPGFELSSETFSFSGVGLTGVRVGPIPGMVGGEAAFVHHADTLYGITVYPERASWPDYAEQVDGLWAQLSNSVRFFTPVNIGQTYFTPEQVCPMAEPGTVLVLREADGWCVLIPEGWQQDVEFNFPERFLGGPNIGDIWPGQPQYANITIGYSGPVGDITLDQQAEGRANANGHPELMQRTDTTVGGYPAIILNTQDGPIPDRVALIHVNGHMYSVLGQPFDAENFAAAQPELEAAWNTMINSIQFFEPFR